MSLQQDQGYIAQLASALVWIGFTNPTLVAGSAGGGTIAACGARAVADAWNTELEESAPISLIGTGPALNATTDNGLVRDGRGARLGTMGVRPGGMLAAYYIVDRDPRSYSVIR